MSLFETKAEAALKVLVGVGYVAAGVGAVGIGIAAYQYATAPDRAAAELDARLAQRLAAERGEEAARKALAGSEAATAAWTRLVESAPEADKKALAPIGRLLAADADAAKANLEAASSTLNTANQLLLVRVAPGLLFART